MNLNKYSFLLILIFGVNLSSFHHHHHNEQAPSSLETNQNLLSQNIPNPTSMSKKLNRRLEVDENETIDNKSVFDQVNLITDQSVQHQLVMVKLDQLPLDFNASLDEIDNQLKAFRKNSDSTIPNTVRISALNAYINNALIMNNLGLLDSTEDESLINHTINQVVIDKPVIKQAKRINRNLAVSKPTHHHHHHNSKSTIVSRKLDLKQNGIEKLKSNPIPVKSRRLNDFSEKTPKNILIDKNSLKKNLKERKSKKLLSKMNKPVERKLLVQDKSENSKEKQEDVKTKDFENKPKRKRRARRTSYRVTQIVKLRQEDELLSLAKIGHLFNVDLDNVYNISQDDMNKYMDKDPKATKNI